MSTTLAELSLVSSAVGIRVSDIGWALAIGGQRWFVELPEVPVEEVARGFFFRLA